MQGLIAFVLTLPYSRLYKKLHVTSCCFELLCSDYLVAVQVLLFGLSLEMT